MNFGKLSATTHYITTLLSNGLSIVKIVPEADKHNDKIYHFKKAIEFQNDNTKKKLTKKLQE